MESIFRTSLRSSSAVQSGIMESAECDEVVAIATFFSSSMEMELRRGRGTLIAGVAMFSKILQHLGKNGGKSAAIQ